MSEETCPAMNFATPIRRMLAIVILTIGPASPWAMASVSRGNHAIGDHSPVHSIRVAARDTAQIDSTSHRKMRRSTQSIKNLGMNVSMTKWMRSDASSIGICIKAATPILRSVATTINKVRRGAGERVHGRDRALIRSLTSSCAATRCSPTTDCGG